MQVFKCLFDLFVPHSYMQLQKMVDHFITYYSIQNIWTCSCQAKKESNISFSQIMLRPRHSSKLLTLQTHHHFILSSATTNPYLFVWRSLLKLGFNNIAFILSVWDGANFLHSSICGTVYWSYNYINRNDYSFLFRIKRNSSERKWGTGGAK